MAAGNNKTKSTCNCFGKKSKESKMVAPLTVRNLTSTPITLVNIERYVVPQTMAISRYANNVTSTIGLTNAYGPPSVAENAESLEKEECNVPIARFSVHNTDKAISDENRITRLTFEVEGEKYRADAPSPSQHTNVLKPLSPNPKFHFSAIFVPEDSFLAIYSSSDLPKWMSHLPDHLSLAALSIPGTHNSPTYHYALPSVRCQAVSPREQLNNGVRFFDIRVQPQHPTDPKRNGLVLVHGVFPIALFGKKYLRGLLNDVKAFLKDNPTETVIISLKREGPGKHTDEQLCRILRDHYLPDEAWFTDPRVPRLGEVRGKMVLMRRFGLDDEARKMHSGTGIGINAEGWSYNTTFDSRGDVTVQDFCEVLEPSKITDKITACCTHLDRCGSIANPFDDSQSGPLYLNFLSASNFWKRSCWPDRVAQKVNPAVVRQLCVKHVIEKGDADWSTGVVVCDWVGDGGDWDLVRCIVGMNAKIMIRSRV